MDDGKAAGPKLKWWSRPGDTPRTEPSAGAGPQAVPPADGTAADAAGGTAGGAADGPASEASGASDASGTPEAQGAQDWIVRPPEPREGAGAGISSESPSESTGSTRSTGSPGSPEVDAAADELTVARGTTAPDRTREEAAGAPGAGTSGARPAPATMALGRVVGAARDEAPSRPDETPDEAATTTTTATATAPASASGTPAAGAPASGTPASGTPSATPPRQQPMHAEDPYGTPPYGGPGPWAPAPPVQRPVATPAHGTTLPPTAAPLPPYGAPPAEPRASHPGLQKSGPPRPSSAPGATPRADAQQPEAAQPVVPQPPDAPQPQPYPGLPADHGPSSAQGRHPAAPQGQPQAPHGAWQHYDPWRAPLQGGPLALSPHDRRRRRGPLVAGAVALALLAGGIGGGIGAYVERYGGISDIRLPQSADDEGGRRPDSVAGIAHTALPGVVTIHVRGSAEQGTGTGFVLDHQGHILTNNHVVQPAGNGGEISVTFSGGQTAKAKVVGQDGGYDLAVVQVEGVTGLRPLTLGNSDSVQVGDPVVAIGAPFDLANTVTSGIISAKQRPITAGGEKGDGSDVSYVDALQTDAPINPGNSGGPLVDAKARVIGINSAIRAADGGSGSVGGSQGGSIGLGFAIPINQAKRVAEELINTGRATHPVIGVTLEMEYAGDGARVSEHSKSGKPSVIPDGPGAKAGIKAGDVITKVDGAPVHSGEELIVKIRSHRPGDTLVLTLLRGGKDRSVRLSLGSSSTG
ncbi:trypsin-like peptidase domain-containing protein [Streptomyces sp. CA2R101]|uniref:trypsin-like peptidase domain-containing protein n=1 Tax=Streptomyces sp. CA2R101 TaxID=3120152 RepID=UPI00300B8C3A